MSSCHLHGTAFSSTGRAQVTAQLTAAANLLLAAGCGVVGSCVSSAAGTGQGRGRQYCRAPPSPCVQPYRCRCRISLWRYHHHEQSELLTLLDHLGKARYLSALSSSPLAVGALISLLVPAARGPIAPISPHAAQIGRTSSAERPASWQSDASPVFGVAVDQDVPGDWSLTASAKFSTRRQSFLALDHSGVARAQSPLSQPSASCKSPSRRASSLLSCRRARTS